MTSLRMSQPRRGSIFVQQFCDERIANILESNGSGVVVFDYDNDGYMDLYFVNPGPLKGVTHEAPGTKRQPNRLYHNNRDGTFTDVTEKAGVGGAGFGIAAAAADYDGDGWTDLYVVNVGKNILYHNNGDGTFTDVTDKAGVGNTGTGIGATWLDVNNDGRLDLYVANYLSFDPDYKLFYNPTSYPGPLAYKPERDVLYINNGDGTFTNASESAGIWRCRPTGPCPCMRWTTTGMAIRTSISAMTRLRICCSLTTATGIFATKPCSGESRSTPWARRLAR